MRISYVVEVSSAVYSSRGRYLIRNEGELVLTIILTSDEQFAGAPPAQHDHASRLAPA